MSGQAQAKWTVMIYANGNNELQPEMWQCKLAAEKVGSNREVTAVLQLGQEKCELAALLRPYTELPVSSRKWTGTRRYLLNEGKSALVKDLGRINMADPGKLYDFIVWAVSAYPAEHYLLVLGGHGYQFVGSMTDYSQNAPYIMGIPEMCRAIELASRQTGAKLDLFVMDICYFNFIEVMYELGKDENHAVQNALTYIDHGPLAGLAYDKLLLAVRANSRNAGPQELCRSLVAGFDADLVVVAIDHVKLTRIKNLYHRIAECYDRADGHLPNLYELLHASEPAHPWHGMVRELHAATQELIISAKRAAVPHLPLLRVANRPTADQARLALYAKLGFAQKSAWTYLLSSKSYRPQENAREAELKPFRLSLDEVATYIAIMNPLLAKDGIQRILDRLYEYKNWLPDH